MKKIILSLMLLALPVLVSAQKINWVTFEEAIEAQKTTPKKIFVDAYTTWCGPCKMLDKNTFNNEDVANYINEHYYAVKFNAEGDSTVKFGDRTFTNPGFVKGKSGRNSVHELARYFGVSAYPTMLFLDEEANYIGPIKGYHTAQQLEFFLKLFKSDVYKELTTQEQQRDYYAKFKPEFKQ